MSKRVGIIEGLLVCVLLLLACGGPAAGPANMPSGRRVIYPVILNNAELTQSRTAWDWPQHGFGWSEGDIANLPEGWYYRWGVGCGSAREVPLVYQTLTADLWRCNDGRPVLVTNEPERPEQANLTPEQVADLVRAVVVGGWDGEVWCCGTWADQIAYNDAVLDSYESRYGRWPATGWHIHAYSGAEWTPDIARPERAQVAVKQVRTFGTHMRARDRLGRGLVISEYGVLSSRDWHQPIDLLPAFTVYEIGFRATPDVLSWAWFSSRYHVFSSSDMLEADGRLTPLGWAWRIAVGR